MKQRNHAFDLLCGLCIVRMIGLHVMQFCGHAKADGWREVMSWTFFFMSFFFFKAGYFNKGLQGDTWTYVRDKAKRLLVPYISSCIIGDIVYFSFVPFLIQRYKHHVEPLEWSMLWERSASFGNSANWFLFSFFAAYVLAHLMEKVRGGHWLVLAFPFVSYWLYKHGNPLWMSLDNVFIAVFFFFLGRMWRRVMEWMGRRTTIVVSALLVAAFIGGNILWHGEYIMSSNTFKGAALPAVFNTCAVLCGLSGLLIAVRIPRIPVLGYIGEHSMVYFISHYPMLYFYKFTHLCFGRSIYGRWDDVIILLPVLFGLCSWLVPYVERVPWLSGRWPQKNKTSDNELQPATVAPAIQP